MTIDKSKIDYSLYLVTNNEMVPEGLDIYTQVEKSLKNGVTIVQLREKDLDTGEFIKRAEKIHQLTKKYNVPLIINDRIDVALAIDAEGVHVGQDDMDPALVRKMIGNDKILGVSTRCEEELMGVINSEALIDYVGIGTVYSTKTKNVKRPPLNIGGLQNLLKFISKRKPQLRSVIIGGLNKTNIPITLANCAYKGFNTDGVAVVSCIMAQSDAALETKETLIAVKLGFGKVTPGYRHNESKVSMVHFITNGVVKNMSANVCIAVGGSPIMSELSEEFDEFAKFPNIGLVLNTGTPTSSTVDMYIDAIKAYNKNMRPIVYDPVGCGASKARRDIMNKLLNVGSFTVIKGNMSEICCVAGVDGSSMRGVDSTMDLDLESSVKILCKLARERECVIVMTGKIDIIVDGITPRKKLNYCIIKGGDDYMSKITGSGCSLGGVIATLVSSTSYFNAYEATIRAVSMYKEAGFIASKQSKGPGSFNVNFIDALYEISKSKEFSSTTISRY